MQPALKLLAPIDLTRDAHAAVQHAIDVASSMSADLTLLYVVDPLRSRPGRPIEWPRNAMVEHSGCYIRRAVLSGPVVEMISQYAEDVDADLVILTSRYGGWTRLWTGSVAADIAASTRGPVSVTSAKALANGRRFRCHRILCVLTLDGSDDPVVLHAEALANRFGGELLLLHVVPELSEALLAYGIAAADDRPLSESVAAQRIRELAAGISCPHSTSIVSGSAYTSISRIARKYGADLAVVGKPSSRCTDGSGLDLRTLLGRLSCPLLSIPTSSAKFELSWKEPPRDVLHKHKPFISPSARLAVHFAAAPGCCTSTRAAYPGHCIRPLGRPVEGAVVKLKNTITLQRRSYIAQQSASTGSTVSIPTWTIPSARAEMDIPARRERSRDLIRIP